MVVSSSTIELTIGFSVSSLQELAVDPSVPQWLPAMSNFLIA